MCLLLSNIIALFLCIYLPTLGLMMACITRRNVAKNENNPFSSCIRPMSQEASAKLTFFQQKGKLQNPQIITLVDWIFLFFYVHLLPVTKMNSQNLKLVEYTFLFHFIYLVSMQKQAWLGYSTCFKCMLVNIFEFLSLKWNLKCIILPLSCTSVNLLDLVLAYISSSPTWVCVTVLYW